MFLYKDAIFLMGPKSLAAIAELVPRYKNFRTFLIPSGKWFGGVPQFYSISTNETHKSYTCSFSSEAYPRLIKLRNYAKGIIENVELTSGDELSFFKTHHFNKSNLLPYQEIILKFKGE